MSPELNPQSVDVLERYQTLIVGLIGFAGVVATLLVNSWLDRRQHRRQVDHERNVLRVALLAELNAVREMLSHQIEIFELAQSDGSSGIIVPITDVSFVYRSTVERIGLLTQREIEAVTNAHLLMRELPDRIRLIQQNTASPEEQSSNFIIVGSGKFDALRQLHENFLSVIEEAIELLDSDN